MRWPCRSIASAIDASEMKPEASSGVEFDQRIGRIEAMEADLRFDGVAVGRKRVFLDEDRGSFFRGPIKTDHHQMQVRRQRIHRHDFARLGADEFGQMVADFLVIRHPRMFARGSALRRRARTNRRVRRSVRARVAFGCRPSEFPQKYTCSPSPCGGIRNSPRNGASASCSSSACACFSSETGTPVIDQCGRSVCMISEQPFS